MVSDKGFRMQLTHYAEHPFDLDTTRSYEQRPPYTYIKPSGLWVSVDGPDDWPAWCRAEQYHLGGLTHSYRVVLAKTAVMLHISTDEQLLDVHGAYSITDELTRHLARDLPVYGTNGSFAFRQRPMDWECVARDYDGILFAPYLWDSRLFGPAWYYGIDAASGCIWNLAAINSFEALTSENAEMA